VAEVGAPTDFRSGGTCTDRLAWLTGDEQKLVKTAAFDLQMVDAPVPVTVKPVLFAHLTLLELLSCGVRDGLGAYGAAGQRG
jgi:hypothetical protein